MQVPNLKTFPLSLLLYSLAGLCGILFFTPIAIIVVYLTVDTLLGLWAIRGTFDFYIVLGTSAPVTLMILISVHFRSRKWRVASIILLVLVTAFLAFQSAPRTGGIQGIQGIQGVQGIEGL